jgi:hypothetical protein
MKITTAGDAIDACGGTQAVADMFGIGYGVVWMWRQRGLPPDTYKEMHDLLSRRHCQAPARLWRQRLARGNGKARK